MKRSLLIAAILLSCLALPFAAGCSGENAGLLESERRLEGMYEKCRNIELIDGENRATIETENLHELGTVEVEAVLKRSNGMQVPGKWAGTPLPSILDDESVARPFRELRIEAWDGYVGRIPFDIAVRQDTILASEENGSPIPREDGPVRLVVASQDGYYWIRMITRIEVLR